MLCAPIYVGFSKAKDIGIDGKDRFQEVIFWGRVVKLATNDLIDISVVTVGLRWSVAKGGDKFVAQ